MGTSRNVQGPFEVGKSLSRRGFYEFGPFHLNPPERLLLRDGQPVALPPKAYDMLVTLVAHAGRLVSKEELLKAVWPGTFVEDANLSYTVSLLRKTLGDDSEPPRYIETVPKAGYRFKGAVVVEAAVMSKEIAGAEASGDAVALPAAIVRKPAAMWAAVVSFALLVGVVTGLLIGGRLWSRGREGTEVNTTPLRAMLPLPDGVTLSFLGGQQALTISPDGQTVVYRGSEKGIARLYRRTLDSGDSVPIPGTEGAIDPFFSPDGQWLGFFAASRIKKVAMAGGAPLVVCDTTPVTTGGTWTDGGWIVFAPRPTGGLSRVSPDGGPVEAFTHLDRTRGEHAHIWPQSLPGGRLLVTVVRGRDFQDVDAAQATVLAPGSPPRVVVEGSSFARVVPGWIVFVRGTAVLAAPFDNTRFEVTGPPIGVSEPIFVDSVQRTASFAVSPAGTVVYATGPPSVDPTANLVRVDRTGAAVPLPLAPAYYQTPRISPDGSRLAVTRYDGLAGRVYVFEFDRQVLTTLTPEPGRFFGPVWSPDGRQIAYSGFELSWPRLHIKNADGSGAVTALTDGFDWAVFPNAWLPGGKEILATVGHNYHSTGRHSSVDLWIMPVDRRTPARPWFETRNTELAPRVSPDGRFIAYVSDESGRFEVYVRPYPGPGARLQVSNNGGREPAWSREGWEILYREGDRFMSVDVRPGTELTLAPPRILFTANFLRFSREDNPSGYDVSKDGTMIVALRPVPRDPVTRQLAVMTNWTQTLARTSVQR